MKKMLVTIILAALFIGGCGTTSAEIATEEVIKEETESVGAEQIEEITVGIETEEAVMEEVEAAGEVTINGMQEVSSKEELEALIDEKCAILEERIGSPVTWEFRESTAGPDEDRYYVSIPDGYDLSTHPNWIIRELDAEIAARIEE